MTAREFFEQRLRDLLPYIDAVIQEEREACAELAARFFDEHRLFEGVRDGGSQVRDEILARGAK